MSCNFLLLLKKFREDNEMLYNAMLELISAFQNVKKDGCDDQQGLTTKIELMIHSVKPNFNKNLGPVHNYNKDKLSQ